MSKSNVSGQEMTIGCLLMILIMPVEMAFRGFVIYKLWGWFVVPLGVASITIAWALGFSVLVSLLKGTSTSSSNEQGDKGFWEIIISSIITAFLVPAFCLFFGWIFSTMMPV